MTDAKESKLCYFIRSQRSGYVLHDGRCGGFESTITIIFKMAYWMAESVRPHTAEKATRGLNPGRSRPTFRAGNWLFQ
jgi:hypothetical protein